MLCKGEWLDITEAFKEQENFDEPDLKRETRARLARLEIDEEKGYPHDNSEIL